MIDIQIDKSGFFTWLNRAHDNLQASARQALGQSVLLALQHARATPRFKDHTHGLRNSLTRGQKGPWVQFIKASAKHALFVEEDTKAHEIRPKRTGTVSSRRGAGKRMAPVLRFQIAGRWFSKAVVKHPGTKGTHFMRDASEVGERALVAMLERAAATAFR